MLSRSLVAALVLTTVACASTREEERAPPPVQETPLAETPPAPKPEIGVFGFDEAGMDTSAKPGVDFYRYANGHWLDSTEIPADRGAFGMFHRLDELSKARTRAIIEEAAKANAAQGTEAQKVGGFFAAFMDEEAIEAAGATPLNAVLAEISAVKQPRDLARLLGKLQRTFDKTPFEVSIGPDDKQPDTYIAQLWQSGLGLPDRDYYLKNDPELAKFRDQYKKHIAATLILAGVSDAAKRAERIFKLEEKIAKAHWSRVDSRDADKVYNKWTRADFDKKAPGLEWSTYFKADGLDGQQTFLVSQPSSLIGVSKLLGAEPLTTWKDYLTFHTIDSAAPLLSKAFVDEDFDFNGHILSGVPEIKERWKRGVERVSAIMGEAVGKLYVAKYFPPEAKARAEALVHNLVVAMNERLGKLEWMTPETRIKAQEKLAAFTAKIGYPDTWRDYSALTIDRSQSAYANEQQAAEFEFQRNLNKLGSPIDRGEWFMTPMMINAYANPVMNEIVFPAAIMQPPFFDPNADDAVNYGGIGAVIGHEMSHHFDDQGRKYDKTGKLENWWSPQDVERFKALTDQVVSQYAQYEPIPGLHVNGELTLGENIADLAGLTVAYDAYHKALGGKDAVVIDGFSGDQRFFLGWAQVWRIKYREQTLREYLMTDPHSPGMARAALVRNLDPWYAAFGVPAGAALYSAPEARIRIW